MGKMQHFVVYSGLFGLGGCACEYMPQFCSMVIIGLVENVQGREQKCWDDVLLIYEGQWV